jgi:PAS domain S-box-containing protein
VRSKRPETDPLGTEIANSGNHSPAERVTSDPFRDGQQSLLAAIVESSDDAIISKDLQGIIRSWNRGAERIFGYTADEVIGKPVTILAVPDRVDEIPNIIERIRRGDRVDHYQTKRQTKYGQVLNISLTVSPIRDASGTIIGASKIARDITDLMRAGEERTAALAREREARQTAELLNRVGPLLVSELNLETLAQKVTDLATQLTGAEFGALFHNVLDERGERYTLYTLSGVPREAFSGFPMPRNTKVFNPTFRGEGVVRSDDITQDPRYGQNPPYQGMPEGHLPLRSYLAAPVVSRSGEVLGGLFFGHKQPGQFREQHEQLAVGIAAQAAIALDNARLFAESQLAREALTRTNTELKRANDALEQFAFSASHDLKEPLRMISVYSQMLQRRYSGKLDAEADRYLGYAVEGARRMEMLVSDLLAYTHSVTPTDEEIAPVSARAVLEIALDNLRSHIQATGATLEIGAMPMLRIQEVHLLQLFQNVIGNAIKYHGEAAPVVQVSAEAHQGLWRFCVRDNGIGIDPAYREQVFGVFKRLHNNDDYQGTGVGLAICQRIVERYGGRIWVESEGAGRGSAFYFTLPGAESAG